MKAEVHRKNSSESSDEQMVEIVVTNSSQNEPKERISKAGGRLLKHQRSKTDGFVSFSIKDEKNSSASFRKLYPQSSTESQENGLLIKQRPSLPSMETEQISSNFPESSGRRHSNFTNCSLSFLPSTVQAEMKPTGRILFGKIFRHAILMAVPFILKCMLHPD